MNTELTTTDFSINNTTVNIRNVGSSVSNSNTDNQSNNVSAGTYANYLSSIVASAGNVVSDTVSLASQVALTGKNLYSSFANIGQYEKLFNSSITAGSSYLNEKLERLQSLWTTKVPVTIGTIVGEIAPYAMNPQKLGQNLEEKISKLMGYIAGTGTGSSTLKEVLKDIGNDALDALESNGQLKTALNSLNVIQGFANGFNAYYTAKDIIKKIKVILEVAQPIKSMATNLAASWCTAGVSALEAENIASTEAQKAVTNIQVLALYAIKKLVFPIKIKLPAILVGAVDSISVRSAMLDLPEEYGWLSTLFNDDFFNNVSYTAMWSDSISTAMNAVKGAVSSVKNMTQDWSKFTYTDSEGNIVVTETGKAVNRGDYMKSLFMEAITKNYMQSAVASARKTAYLPNYSEISWITKGSSAKYTSDITSSTTSSLSSLDRLLKDDSDQNPVINVDAIVTISKLLYDNII